MIIKQKHLVNKLKRIDLTIILLINLIETKLNR